jgi:hypothetical protein
MLIMHVLHSDAEDETMQRTSLMFPDALKAQAQERARQEGISLGELVRQAIEARLEASRPDGQDPFFTDDAVWRGPAESDLARHHDRYLYDGPGHDGRDPGGAGGRGGGA